jgi:hypothetical protein
MGRSVDATAKSAGLILTLERDYTEKIRQKFLLELSSFKLRALVCVEYEP